MTVKPVWARIPILSPACVDSRLQLLWMFNFWCVNLWRSWHDLAWIAGLIGVLPEIMCIRLCTWFMLWQSSAKVGCSWEKQWEAVGSQWYLHSEVLPAAITVKSYREEGLCRQDACITAGSRIKGLLYLEPAYVISECTRLTLSVKS